jgi:hypothetical protein
VNEKFILTNPLKNYAKLPGLVSPETKEKQRYNNNEHTKKWKLPHRVAFWLKAKYI